MSTSRSAGAAGLVLALLLSGCSGSAPSSDPAFGDGPDPSGGPTSSSTPAPGDDATGPDLPQVSSDLVGDLQGVLDIRSDAILRRDREVFLAGLAASPDLRTAEGVYFDNLVQLPLDLFTYRVLPASLVRTRNSYWGVVQIDLQLSPYDVLPVRTLDRFRFVRVGAADSGRFAIASTTDAEWEAANVPVKQPWETERIKVREGAGVLGLFNQADIRERAGIVASVERGILDIAGRVPFSEWGQQAVVYALSDRQFLDGFESLPGGDPQALDGVAFTVPTGTDDTSIASTRFALSPEMLPLASARRVDPELDRLVRHELVHVAVGVHDDEAPVWLSEGIAEWASVQALPPQRRDVPASAIAAARRGIDTMPSDEAFNDDDAAIHYALAWWVCEWLVKTYGADAPWTLLRSFEIRAGDDQREVVRDVIGISVDQLARRGGQLMASSYAPPPEPSTPAPTTGPSAPGPTQGGSPSPASDYTIID